MPNLLFAVYCSALRCVAVRCGVLQCAAVCCSALRCVAVCCGVLQCAAVCCSALRCVVVYRKALQILVLKIKSRFEQSCFSMCALKGRVRALDFKGTRCCALLSRALDIVLFF